MRREDRLRCTRALNHREWKDCCQWNVKMIRSQTGLKAQLRVSKRCAIVNVRNNNLRIIRHQRYSAVFRIKNALSKNLQIPHSAAFTFLILEFNHKWEINVRCTRRLILIVQQERRKMWEILFFLVLIHGLSWYCRYRGKFSANYLSRLKYTVFINL